MADILGTDILGTIGDDILNGTNGDDTITTLAGNDTVDAGAGDDIVIADENGTGNIDGGDGFDTVQIISDNSVRSISTRTGQPSLDLFGGYSLTSVERLELINSNGEIDSFFQLGSTGDDTIDLTTSGLTFDSNAFILLLGGDGNDTLTAINSTSLTVLGGGNGDDTLIGGTGRTCLLYTSPSPRDRG